MPCFTVRLSLAALLVVYGFSVPAYAVVCDGSTCVESLGQCGGTGMGGTFKACCNESDVCVRKSAYYSQCRPSGDPWPKSWEPLNPSVVTCSTEAAQPPPASEAAVITTSVMLMTTKEGCGQIYSNDVGVTCGATCELGRTLAVGSTDACLVECMEDAECHCSLYDDTKKECSLLWTPCDAAVLGLHSMPGSTVHALQPCVDYPIEVTFDAPITSTYGDCSPMQLYPGVLVAEEGCTGNCTSSVVTNPPDDLDACIKACINSGYRSCKSAQFKPAGSFGLTENECTLYSTPVEYMGAHATVQVLANNGLGAVVASFCEPPEPYTKFPTNDVADFGVEWDGHCHGKETATVPGMRMGCGSCAYIPDNRLDQVEDYDFDELHFASPSLDSCVADCAANADCGCAFFRIDDFPEPAAAGYCSLTTADCSHPVVGAQVDFTRTRTAIAKCGYSAPADVVADWPDETYEMIDWFAVWDDVCEYSEPYTYRHKNTYCGPSCVAPGTHTTREGSEADCSQRCASTTTCACSYYQEGTGLCTLMYGVEYDDIAEACENYDMAPGAMFFEPNETLRNEVTLLCSFGSDLVSSYEDYLY